MNSNRAINVAINGSSKGLQQAVSQGVNSLKGLGAVSVAQGNLLAGAISKGIDLTAQFVAASASLAVEAVKLAADFQTTTNAMSVFAGSARLAKEELAAIDKAARNTDGLRLEGAEKGYAQLRALGFQAETTKKLIVGLGKEKLLSPLADDGAIQRVIVNLTQLSAGSNRAAQDIKEIIHSLPGMRAAFQDAFGTVDPKKLKEFFDTDPDKAIEKLADAMAKLETPAGGLNTSLGKLADAGIELGRTFGEPLLDGVTGDVKNFTSFLYENQTAVQKWGQNLADTLNGIRDAYRESQNKEFFLTPFLRNVNEQNKKDGGRDLYQDFINIGKYADWTSYFREPAKKKREDAITNAPKYTSLADYRSNSPEEMALNKEALKAREQADRRKELLEENAKQKSLANLKLEADEAKAILQNRFAVESALRDTSIRYTSEQEIKFLTENGKAKDNFLKSEIARTTGFYDKQLALQNLSDEEAQKLTVEKNKALSDLNKDLKLNAIDTFKDIQNQQLKSFEAQRKAAIDFKNLQSRESQFKTDNSSFDISRAIEQGNIAAVAGFDKLKQITQTNLAEQLKLTRENYDLQLKDKSLTDEQIVNLTKERDLDLKDLAEKSRRDILRIEDDKRAKQLQSIESFYQNLREIQSIRFDNALLTFQNLIGGGFSESVFTAEIDKIKNGITTFAQFNKTIIETKGELEKLKRGSITKNGSDGLDGLTLQRDALVNKDGAQLTDEEIKRSLDLGEQINKLTNERTRLEDVLTTALKDRVAFLQGNPDVWGLEQGAKLVELLKTADFSKLKTYTDIQKELVNLQYDKDYNDVFSKLRQNIDSQATATDEQLKKLQEQADVLLSVLNSLGIKKKAALQDVTNNSPEGIKAAIEDLKTNAFARGQIVYDANVAIWKEAKSLAEENIALESRFYENSVYLAEQRKNKLLNFDREVFELRKELNEKSLFSQSESDAKVLSYLNSQIKSSSDTLADFKITIAGGFFEQINSPFGALSKKLEGLPPLIRGVAQGFIGLANDIVLAFSKKIILQLLGLGDDSGKSGSSGSGFWGIIKNIIGGGSNRGGASGSSALGNSAGGSLAGALSGLIGSNSSHGSSAAPGGTSSGFGSIFGSEGFGNNVGTYGALGTFAALAGSAIGGRTGGFISGAGAGLGIGAQIGSMILPGIGTAFGAAIGAIGGGLLSLLGGDPKRKKDKKENIPALNKGFVDAMAEFQQLLKDSDALKIEPPESALTKGLDIRSQIASGFGIKFESKKYQKEAQSLIAAQLLAIDKQPDGLMQMLKDSVDRAKSASETRKRLGVAEFATGTYLDSSFAAQYNDFKRMNGMLQGNWTGKDEIPALLAKGEMVLNPRQIQGVIDVAGFNPFKYINLPKYADGVYIPPTISAMTAGGSSVNVNLSVPINVTTKGSGKPSVDEIVDAVIDGFDREKLKGALVKALVDVDVNRRLPNRLFRPR